MAYVGFKPTWRSRVNYGHLHAQGMVAYYVFDGGGGLTVYDAFSGRTGTLTNGPTWGPNTSGRGNGGYGINFTSASSQYLDLGTPPSLDFAGGSMSIAASVYYPTKPNFSNFMVANKGSQWALDVEGPSNRFRFYINGGGSGALWAEGITTNDRDQIVGGGSWDLPSTIGYVVGEGKGVVSSSAPFASIPSSSSVVRIGSTSAGGSYWNGAINWIAFWNKSIPSGVMQDFQRNPMACLVDTRAHRSLRLFPSSGGALTKSSSDTGSASETGTVAATLSSSDSASAADAGTLNATVSSSDSGSAADSGPFVITFGTSDGSTFTESTSLSAVVSSSDSGSAGDVGTTSNGPTPDSDTFTLAETYGLTVTVSSSDSGSAGDTGTASTGPIGSDTFTLSEAYGLTVTVGSSDSSSAGESSLISQSLTSTDTFAFADSGTVVVNPAVVPPTFFYSTFRRKVTKPDPTRGEVQL